MSDLTFLIPSRNEEFLLKTIEDLLGNTEAEILVALDGWFIEIPENPRVKVLHFPESIGQRRATTELVKLCTSKYVAKVDAHCAFDKDWDLKMLKAFEEVGDSVTMVSTMRNLHAFDWLCPQGHRRYQGPSGVCAICGGETKKDILWFPKPSPQSKSYCFDSTPHFQYFGEFNKRDEGKGELTETMSLQGSCFMLTKEKYFELKLDDENFPSWGSQGIQVACATWLSGGRVVVNQRTWYAHMFRTQGGDFSFPYHNPQSQVDKAKEYAGELLFNNKWPNQIHSLSWLLEKFWPVPGWTEDDLNKLKKPQTKGVVYISDNHRDESLLKPCREQLRKSFDGKIVSVTHKPTDLGENIVVNLKSEKLSIFKQILIGLEALDTDIVYLCDDDCLYSPSHFGFIPPRNDTFYYNLNWWRVRSTDGFAVHYDAKQSNFLCANRELLISEYKERVRKVEAEGWHKGGFEPGTRSLKKGGFSDSPSATWKSLNPNIDIRHGKNLTGDKWKKEDFRDPRYSAGWNERYYPSWKESEISNWQNVV